MNPEGGFHIQYPIQPHLKAEYMCLSTRLRLGDAQFAVWGRKTRDGFVKFPTTQFCRITNTNTALPRRASLAHAFRMRIGIGIHAKVPGSFCSLKGMVRFRRIETKRSQTGTRTKGQHSSGGKCKNTKMIRGRLARPGNFHSRARSDIEKLGIGVGVDE